MSLLYKADAYPTQKEKTDRKSYYAVVLALVCVALALVVASAMFPDAFGPSGEFSLFGP
jgi:hypothetical protein